MQSEVIQQQTLYSLHLSHMQPWSFIMIICHRLHCVRGTPILVFFMVGFSDQKLCRTGGDITVPLPGRRSAPASVDRLRAHSLLSFATLAEIFPLRNALRDTAVKYLPTSESNLKSLEHLRQEEPLRWQDCDSYVWFEHPGSVHRLHWGPIYLCGVAANLFHAESEH